MSIATLQRQMLPTPKNKACAIRYYVAFDGEQWKVGADIVDELGRWLEVESVNDRKVEALKGFWTEVYKLIPRTTYLELPK